MRLVGRARQAAEIATPAGVAMSGTKAGSGPVRNVKARRRPATRAHGIERLEKREVLSSFSWAVSRQATVDLAIRGTDIQYSELGLPASMSGDLFSAGAHRIGR